jgi:glycosyltransferase involved in cell wall biosynthesis
LSLVISTLGRSDELARLLASLAAQTFQNFEVVVVDQNADDRVSAILTQSQLPFPVDHVRTPQARGLSRGRNIGWQRSRGEILLFPDDDCWYPPDFLAQGLAIKERLDLDLLSGRSADVTGKSINGRYSLRPHYIARRNIWTSQIEWATFVDRKLLLQLNGYDEQLGVGASTPWQAAEGPDLILRALALHAKCYFDPTLYGFHGPFEITGSDERTICKARAYARGMGYVLRRHQFGIATIAYWASRSIFNTMRYGVAGNAFRARFYSAVATGRVEGWLNRANSDLQF